MTDDTGPLENLAAHAHDTHVVIVGGGIAGLVAALECAKVGLRVTVLDAGETPGGVIRSGEVGGAVLDLGADGYSLAGGAVSSLVDELGLTDDVAAEAPTLPWVSGIPSGAAPLPADTVLGIPANPWDPAVRAVIGWAGVWRAYLDRLRPPLTIGQERSLGRLVRKRMGDRVVDRLVAPLSVGRFGLAPDDVDVDAAAPGLNPALTRTGSLGGAVAQLGGDSAAPGYATLRGGMVSLVEALQARLGALGADLVADARVERIARDGAGGWDVRHGAEVVHADTVVVAVPEDQARELLAPHVTQVGAAAESAPVLDVVTLVVDAAVVESSPRGAVVYAVPGSAAAAAVVVTSRRWPSVAARLGPEAHAVRVMFPGGAPDGDASVVAREAASALLGVTIDEGSVRGARLDRHEAVPPRSARGRREEADRVRAAVAAVDGLAAVGGWIAGSGLAQVVPDAVAEAERVRRRAIFGAAAID